MQVKRQGKGKGKGTGPKKYGKGDLFEGESFFQEISKDQSKGRKDKY